MSVLEIFGTLLYAPVCAAVTPALHLTILLSASAAGSPKAALRSPSIRSSLGGDLSAARAKVSLAFNAVVSAAAAPLLDGGSASAASGFAPRRWLGGRHGVDGGARGGQHGGLRVCQRSRCHRPRRPINCGNLTQKEK